MALLILCLALLLLGAVCIGVGYLQQQRQANARQLEERLRIQREQFRAEQQLHIIAQSGMQAMFDAAREAQSPPSDGEWYQP